MHSETAPKLAFGGSRFCTAGSIDGAQLDERCHLSFLGLLLGIAGLGVLKFSGNGDTPGRVTNEPLRPSRTGRLLFHLFFPLPSTTGQHRFSDQLQLIHNRSVSNSYLTFACSSVRRAMSVPIRYKVPLPTCPIGDRPAVCLTQYLPPETACAILTLDGGDPRDILFTIHCRLANPVGST